MSATAIVSLTLTTGFLFLPLAGTDLAAQVARGHFVLAYGMHPVDFRWYGGIFPYGYSLLAGPANALLGARGVGACGSVVGALALAFLFTRTGVRRPLAGSLLGAACLVCNLISGRTTFALGIAVGLLALCAVALDEVGPVGRRTRTAGAFVLAALATAASPVAGLFVGLCGAALLLTGRRRDGLALAVGAGLPLLVPAVLFPGTGRQPFSALSAILPIVTAVAVAFLVPARYRAVRVGALLTAVGVLLAQVIPNPVGSNATRLVMLFGIPVVAATADLGWRRLAFVLVILALCQPPLVLADVNRAGSAATYHAFFRPLVNELDTRRPLGRVEVVPLHDHWESTYVADAVPLARGWERQVDVARNPIFYDGTLNPRTYLSWLQNNGVSYVALARGASFDAWGRREAALVRSRPSYLQPVWQDPHWALYKIDERRPVVASPAVLVQADATGLTFDVRRPGLVPIRVAWSRWLTLSGTGGCLLEDGRWTMARIDHPGTYRLSSGWQFTQPDRCPAR